MATLIQIKEQALAYQPLMLAKITLTDGTILRLATHGLRTADNGFQYAGADWLPRIVNTRQAATQAMSEQGIDTPPSVTLRLADSDRLIFRNYEKTIGFKGADLEIIAVFWNVGTNEFSDDYQPMFRGVCDPAKLGGKQLSIAASSKLNMQRIALPSTRIQKYCPWQFPTTSAERISAANDSSQIGLYRCGYSPDVSGGNARGNYSSGTTPFTSCDYTKVSCVARGMYKKDSSNRITGRFGGIQWDPPNQFFNSREYVSGNMVPIYNLPNEAKYNSFHPEVLGTAWVDAPICSFVSDANYSKFECTLTVGDITASYSVLRVIVNDVEIPYASPGNITAWWNFVNTGDREGAPNTDQFYEGLGDPYGSLACIGIVVPRRLADSGSSPRVRVLLKGPGLRTYSNTTTYADASTDNSAWVLLALLARARWKYSEINIQSFIDAAAYCDATISAKSIFGGTYTAKRYRASLSLVQRRSAAEIIRGVRMACKGLLVPGPSGLELRIQKTLADQQGSAVAGSNYNTAVTSKTAAGTTANGYVAYDFNESNILPNGEDTSLQIDQLGIAEQPNVIGFSFPNSQNFYSQDAITQIDTRDVSRVGQEITSTLQMEGIVSFDQALRAIATYRAELEQGNPRGDSGGTYFFSFETSFKALHLKMGDICRFSDQQNDITNQLIRILEIEPSTNFERVRIKARWHNDDWYTDAWGQDGVPGYSGNGRAKLLRPPYPWLANYEAPWANDSMFATSDKFFGLSQKYETRADFTGAARAAVTGYETVNSFSSGSGMVRPPLIAFQGSTTSTGGYLLGGRTYFVALCAKDSNGKFSTPSQLCAIYVPAGTNTNKITATVESWDTATAGYALFVSDEPGRMSCQGESGSLPAWITASGTTPSTITISGPLSVSSWGLPDVEYDRKEIRIKRGVHSGLWGLPLKGMASSALTFSETEAENIFGSDNYAGYDISLLALANADGSPYEDPVPIINRTISSVTGGRTINLSQPLPAVEDVPIDTDSVWVLRSKPTNITSNSLEDPLWQSAIYPDGLDDCTGRILRFISGTARGTTAKIASNTATVITIEGTWQVTPDSTSRYIIEEQEWQESVYTTSALNPDPTRLSTIPVPVENFIGQTLVVQPIPLDGEDTEAFDQLSPVREIYIYGSKGLTQQFQTAVDLSVSGTLAIGSDFAPRISMQRPVKASYVQSYVKQAPIGADITAKIYVDGVEWTSITIPAGDTSASNGDVSALPEIGAGQLIRLDITAVGSTYPGSDLSVLVYL